MNEFLTDIDLSLLLRLLTAHLLGDFLFQRSGWISERQNLHFKAPTLYLHVLIIGLLTYLFSGQYQNFRIPLALTAAHFLTDLWKSYRTDNIFIFLSDQLIHFATIVIAWYFYVFPDIRPGDIIAYLFNNPKHLIIIVAYIFIIWPSGYMISKFTKHWQDQLGDVKGLQDAGRWIGIFERVLILTFVLVNQYAAIGFLIAAKSVLRFGDVKNPDNRKSAEFILIGTMISFIVAILTGIAVNHFIR